MDHEIEFTHFVIEYCRLQKGLLDELARLVDLGAREFFNTLPTGELVYDSTTWRYQGHGRGVTIARDGATVNAHLAPFISDGVDAWRLSVHADACGITQYIHNDQHFGTDEDTTEQLLDALAAEGKLVRQEVEGLVSGHRFYRPLADRT